jgi:hypothetical protein
MILSPAGTIGPFAGGNVTLDCVLADYVIPKKLHEPEQVVFYYPDGTVAIAVGPADRHYRTLATWFTLCYPTWKGPGKMTFRAGKGGVGAPNGTTWLRVGGELCCAIGDADVDLADFSAWVERLGKAMGVSK